MSEDEGNLLTLVGRGDTAAFGAFYDRFSARILGLLVRWLRDRRDADEVLQDTFWQVWKTATTFDPVKRSEFGWLVMLARSRAADCLRRKVRRASQSLVEEPGTITDPVGPLQQSELGQLVHDAVNELDADIRRAVCLSFYEGLTHVEIAARLQIPLGTVKTRIRSGMMQLRTRLRRVEQEMC